MGQYLEALHHTGYYYTFIGIVQVTAAILILIPRTVTLGALLYLPIIVNICILSFALRFDGSHVTAPLMVLANLYLLAWNYDKLKLLFPHKTSFKSKYSSKKLPIVFSLGVLFSIGVFILYSLYGHEVMPRNSIKDCKMQFNNSLYESAGLEFCDCIHINGGYLNECLKEYEKAKSSN